MKKFFVGIYNVVFDEGCKIIVVMKFLDGEVVFFKRLVIIIFEVEVSGIVVMLGDSFINEFLWFLSFVFKKCCWIMGGILSDFKM